jgi:hypothetical protein
MRILLALALALTASAQNRASLDSLNHGRPVLDAHNCNPYNGQWADRIDRALSLGFPVSIEQDIAWAFDPADRKGTAGGFPHAQDHRHGA